MLSIPETPQLEGMGNNINLASVLAYDVSELVNSNPWTESAELTELPVYVNSRPTFPWPPSIGESQFDEIINEMNTFLSEIAGRLKIPEEELIFSGTTPSEEIIKKTEGEAFVTEDSAQWQDITLTVHYDMTAEIRFSEPIRLPDEYSVSDKASYDEIEKAASYIKEEYNDLIDMKDPQINIYGGDYTYDGQKSSYKLSFYDGNGSYENQLIQYNFYQMEFCFDDNNEIYLIRIYNTDLSNTVGNYPIITFSEAKQPLSDQLAKSSENSETGDTSIIAGGELVYRFQEYDEYFIPYYKFYVEKASEYEENGLKQFTICYVPAIEERFIEYYAETNTIRQ